MKTSNIRLLTLITIGIGLCSCPGQNLLLNGGFEQPGDPGTIDGYAYFVGGSTAIPGWETILAGVEYIDLSRPNHGTANGFFGVAQDGSFCLDLAPKDYTGGGIRQTFTTIPGTNYVVSFFIGTMANWLRDGTGHCLATAANTTNSFAVTNTAALAAWEPRSYTFTAVSTNTTLTFSTSDDANVHYVMIDNVMVVPQNLPLSVVLDFYPGIRINGQIGHSYLVQWTEPMTSTNWHGLAYVTLQTSSQFVFDTTAPRPNTRFYRAVEMP